MPNYHMAILKQEFGIGLRDKQKLNFDWETERYVGMGALPMTNDWIDTSHGHGFGRKRRERQLWVVAQSCIMRILPVSAVGE